MRGSVGWVLPSLGIFAVAFAGAGVPRAVSGQVESTDSTGVYGWVRGDDGRPVAGAEVVAVRGAGRTTTDAEGFFALIGAFAGEDTLVVRHLSYAERRIPVVTIPGFGLRVEVDLAVDPLELEGIRLEVRPSLRLRQMARHRRRREIQSGLFLSATQLEERGLVPLGEILSIVPGLRVQRNGAFGTPALLMRGQRCFPRVWIDGREAFGQAGSLALRELKSADLEALEVYRGHEAPADLAGPCLTIVAWTRRGAGE